MKILALAFLAVTPIAANELPDMPAPKPIQRSVVAPRFMDRPAKIAAVTTVSLLAFDAAQTCHNLATGGHEDFLPTKSCAGVIGIMSAEAGALWLGAHVAHRHGWHKIERILEWTMPAVNTRALVYSKQHGSF